MTSSSCWVNWWVRDMNWSPAIRFCGSTEGSCLASCLFRHSNSAKTSNLETGRSDTRHSVSKRAMRLTIVECCLVRSCPGRLPSWTYVVSASSCLTRLPQDSGPSWFERGSPRNAGSSPNGTHSEAHTHTMVTKHSSLHFSTNSPYMSFSWHLRHGYKSDPTAASSLYTWPPDLVESCCLDATPLYRERGLEGRREGEEGGRRKGGGRKEGEKDKMMCARKL